MFHSQSGLSEPFRGPGVVALYAGGSMFLITFTYKDSPRGHGFAKYKFSWSSDGQQKIVVFRSGSHEPQACWVVGSSQCHGQCGERMS
jgi:hypothetical protein